MYMTSLLGTHTKEDILAFVEKWKTPVFHAVKIPLDDTTSTKQELDLQDIQPVFSKTSLEKQFSTVCIRFGRGQGHKGFTQDVQVISKVINYGGGFVKILVEHGELELNPRDNRRSVPRRLDQLERDDLKRRKKDGEEILDNPMLFTFMYDREKETWSWIIDTASFEEELILFKEERDMIHSLEINYFRWMKEVGLGHVPKGDFTLPVYLQDKNSLSMEKKRKKRKEEELEKRGIYTAPFASFLPSMNGEALYLYLSKREAEIELIETYHYVLYGLGKLEQNAYELLLGELHTLKLFYQQASEHLYTLNEKERKEVIAFNRDQETKLLDRLTRPGYYVTDYDTNPLLVPNMRTIYDSFGEHGVVEEKEEKYKEKLHEYVVKAIPAIKAQLESTAIKEERTMKEMTDYDRLVFIETILPAVLKDLK